MQPIIDATALQRGLNATAASYENADVIAKEVGQRLLERLRGITVQPRVIIDLGSADGRLTQQLSQQYPKADIFAVDIAQQRNEITWQATKRWKRRIHPLTAQAQQLPFLSHSVDMVFSNMCFYWVEDLTQLFTE